MNVTRIPQNSLFCNYKRDVNNKNSSLSFSLPKNIKSVSQNNIPASIYKANFVPSFGKFRKVGDVTILNRDTGRTVRASLQKESIGNTYHRFRVLVNNEEVGFMALDCDAIFEENDFVLSEPDNNIPKVTMLRTLKGEQYAGIGSALLNVAVDESKKYGRKGALWLVAEEGYARTYSAYRRNESPIPFYYKLGFKTLDKELHKMIKEGINSSNYNKLPRSVVLVLPSSKADYLQKYYENHYTKNWD